MSVSSVVADAKAAYVAAVAEQEQKQPRYRHEDGKLGDVAPVSDGQKEKLAAQAVASVSSALIAAAVGEVLASNQAASVGGDA